MRPVRRTRIQGQSTNSPLRGTNDLFAFGRHMCVLINSALSFKSHATAFLGTDSSLLKVHRKYKVGGAT